MNFEKISFRWKAKGRHGTHSPFVYHFVEEVLRNKSSFKNCPQFLSDREWSRLNAAIRYLSPENIYLLGDEMRKLEESLAANHPSVAVFRAGDAHWNVSGKKVLLLADSIKLAEFVPQINLLKSGNFEQTAVYLFHPHQTASVFFNVERQLPLLDFKMVLDCWDALLLVDSPDFKEEQFFRLK